jgi:hypothetical protein
MAMASQYAASEITTIQWGNANDALSILEPHVEGKGTENSFKEPGMGPRVASVDRNGNFIFASIELNYLKGFDVDGQLLFDLMIEGIPIYQRLAGRAIRSLLVDSSFIYIVSADGLPIIPIIDYDGNIVDSLVPFGEVTSIEIGYLSLNYDASLSIMGFIRSDFQTDIWVMTYKDNDYIPGGSIGFLASNGSYYAGWANSIHSLGFNRYNDPDTAEQTEDVTEKVIDCPGDSIRSASILNGGDGNRLYVYIRKLVDGYITFEVWEFDLEYTLLAKAVFPYAENKYDWFITPFVSRDGTIYEFRCLDDGLHVVKWTKQ